MIDFKNKNFLTITSDKRIQNIHSKIKYLYIKVFAVWLTLSNASGLFICLENFVFILLFLNLVYIVTENGVSSTSSF